MTGGSLGGDYTGSNHKKSTSLMAVARKLISEVDNGVCHNTEEMSEPTKTTSKSLFDHLNDPILSFGDFPILNKIKPLMDQFDKYHNVLYQNFESNKKNIIQLPSTQVLDNKALNSKFIKNSTNSFLGRKNSVVQAQNKTSTLFCPSGFEFFKTNQKMRVDEEFKMNPEFTNMNNGLGPRSRTLDIEKAEYVQLLLPKHSIGRMGITDNSSEIENLPFYQKAEEDNSLIEVWCKIFAVRDIGASF